MIVSEIKFNIWRLENWWVFCNSPEFYPKGRKHLIGNWFFKIKNK